MSIETARSHRPRLIQSDAAHAVVHGSHTPGRWNAWLAVRITRVVGSMWCAYAFALLAFVSLPAALRSHDPVILIAWVSQTFLQLVLLSVIMVGQNVQAVAGDARAEADHQTLEAVHTLTVAVYAINEQQSEILRRLEGRG